MVIGLGLCPFADKAHGAGTIRYAICSSSDPAAVLQSFVDELHHLVRTPRSEIETTLLITPAIHPEFLDFNDFVGQAEDEVKRLALTDTVQIVGFHPRFRFEQMLEEAPENYTNRSPHPILHLLREISVTEASETFGDLGEIPKKNTATLQRLGIAGILERLKGPYSADSF
jgi:uncharacterized protein